ncbi:hypothetical protein MATL_G00237080 [Megalops atlanticus]|uniref:Uncharacterized protein n=1 Tax=Megalops atlanticus TaxID=7932 RepID=A0A9D3PBP9_MEGAT|nr:hypothetical protein MATL_G00237080 [Megalops atlanticus]
MQCVQGGSDAAPWARCPLSVLRSARITCGRRRSLSEAALASPAGPYRQTRHRVPAQKHQADPDPRLAEEDQHEGWHRGDPEEDAEGTEVPHALTGCPAKRRSFAFPQFLVRRVSRCGTASLPQRRAQDWTSEHSCWTPAHWHLGLLMSSRLLLQILINKVKT